MARSEAGAIDAVMELLGRMVPDGLRELGAELEDRFRKVPNQLNEFGFDPYGMSPEEARRMFLPTAAMYRYYFRVENFDIDRVPEGRVMLIANHAGQLPFDGMMITMAMLLAADPPRICRSMGEYFLPRLPWMGTAMARGGAMVGTPENCVHMLDNDECVLVFPEGARGMNKVYTERYRLQRMGLGFMRLALETATPIVPIAVVGSDDQQPGIANFESLGKRLGLPALPITLGFPLLGPLGMLPMPVKYRIYFGEPMVFEGDSSDDDAAIQHNVDAVKETIETMLARGVRARKGIFGE
jgi:1-acyl-sn-glycerol-3-phosphate acyltransferase